MLKGNEWSNEWNLARNVFFSTYQNFVSQPHNNLGSDVVFFIQRGQLFNMTFFFVFVRETSVKVPLGLRFIILELSQTFHNTVFVTF